MIQRALEVVPLQRVLESSASEQIQPRAIPVTPPARAVPDCGNLLRVGVGVAESAVAVPLQELDNLPSNLPALRVTCRALALTRPCPQANSRRAERFALGPAGHAVSGRQLACQRQYSEARRRPLVLALTVGRTELGPLLDRRERVAYAFGVGAAQSFQEGPARVPVVRFGFPLEGV